MNKIAGFLVIFLICFSSIAQQKAIKLVNFSNQKEVIIKDGKRVRATNYDGKKFSGKLKILSEELILIKKDSLYLSNLAKLKRHPLALSIPTSVVMVTVGTIATVYIVGISLWADDTQGLFFALPSALMVYGGIKSPNFLKGYKTENNWSYEIIDVN